MLQMQVAQQGALPLMPQSPLKHDYVQQMQRAPPSLLPHQQTLVATSALSEQARPHVSIHDMLANARGVSKSPRRVSASQPISRLSANRLSQQEVVTSVADCGRAVVPQTSTAGWLAVASDAMQMSGQPLSLSSPQKQHDIHMPKSDRCPAAGRSSLQLADTEAAVEDAVPPHTAVAISKANAVLGQSRQLATVAAAAQTTGSAAAAVPVSSAVVPATELAAVNVDSGTAAAADRDMTFVARTADTHVQSALPGTLAAALADSSVHASSAADQPAAVQTHHSYATDELATADQGALLISHAAKEPCSRSTADDACARTSMPVLDGHASSFLGDDVAVHSTCVEPFRCLRPLQQPHQKSGNAPIEHTRKSSAPPPRPLSTHKVRHINDYHLYAFCCKSNACPL